MRDEESKHRQRAGLEEPARKACGARGLTAAAMGPDAGGLFFFPISKKKKKKKTAKETSTKSCNCPLPKTTAL